MNFYPTEKISKGDHRYPQRMAALRGMPAALYLIGKLPAEDCPTAAIIGARSCSNYGKNIAREFARVLSNEGVQIISGLALGIDGESHWGALQGKTPTFAVLANDVERCYPASHQRLYERILKQGGGIIGEHPQGTPALPAYFPARNRIISALSDVVLVVEARQKSGALITVDFALDQGKSVFAVPGRVGDATSEGCHRLISEGAGIAYTPDIILEELGREKAVRMENIRQYRLSALSVAAQYVYQRLELAPLSLEDLRRRVPYSLPELLTALAELEMADAAEEISKGYYVKRSE